MSTTKACTRCKEVKPCSMFGVSSGAPDGLQYYCKACKTEHQRERRRKKREARQDQTERDRVEATRHRTHLVIPDIQARPGVPLDHCKWLGQYIARRQPDVIVCLGDLWDYKSLSSYDEGKKAAEGLRLIDDYEAGLQAIQYIMEPWHGMWNPETGETYAPELYFTRGNHENRRNRYENDYPKLEGALPDETEAMRALGWTCPDFLEPITVDGIVYSHYFCRGANGKVNQSKRGQPSAVAQAKREMCTSIAGHAQGLDSAIVDSCKGRVRAIIAGSFYLHDEAYKSPQGNNHWHGVLWLNRVKDGDFDLTEVSIGYLEDEYGLAG